MHLDELRVHWGEASALPGLRIVESSYTIPPGSLLLIEALDLDLTTSPGLCECRGEGRRR
jgi:hypothetical protein